MQLLSNNPDSFVYPESYTCWEVQFSLMKQFKLIVSEKPEFSSTYRIYKYFNWNYFQNDKASFNKITKKRYFDPNLDTNAD